MIVINTTQNFMLNLKPVGTMRKKFLPKKLKTKWVWKSEDVAYFYEVLNFRQITFHFFQIYKSDLASV